ncbi:hypothetical protein KC19_6G218400 [Ceratodon purpureus]|uniref:Uncharacterized protein n=1 Tax=Ceratodon purpureus TaxID=3225 RepID=A0A8T0HK55_CERPU|nr:hypothetical protein KC19_6G218400 [Ceratodon purpureus]
MMLDVNLEDEAEEDGANVDLDSQRKGKCVVLKTSTRQVSGLHVAIFCGTVHGVDIWELRSRGSACDCRSRIDG